MKKTIRSSGQNSQDETLVFNVKREEEDAIPQYGNKEYFNDLAERFQNANDVHGTARDFLNFSISFKENDNTIFACKVLKRGLDIYKNDIELLAYYINCAIDGGIRSEIEECKNRYEDLMRNPMESYTVGVFNSILKYLHIKTTLGCDNREKIKMEAEHILNAFYRLHPNTEDSYFSDSEFIDGKEQQKLKLKAAVKKLSSCPRCALKLADMLCEEGDYIGARTIVEKCLRSVQTLPKHNRAYAYYLLGICEFGVFQNHKYFLSFINIMNDKNKNTSIQKIYNAFKIARNSPHNDLRNVYIKEMERIIYTLEQQTGVPFQ